MQDYSPATIRAYDLLRRDKAYSGTLPAATQPVSDLMIRMLTIMEGLSSDPQQPQNLQVLKDDVATALNDLRDHLHWQIENITTTLPVIQSASTDLIALKKIARGTEESIVDVCVGSLKFQAGSLMGGLLSVALTLMERLPNISTQTLQVMEEVSGPIRYMEEVIQNPKPYAEAMFNEVVAYPIDFGSNPNFITNNQDQISQIERLCRESIPAMITKERSNIERMMENLMMMTKAQTFISMRRSGFGSDLFENILSPELLKELDIITKVP
jgi:hypothetical protein